MQRWQMTWIAVWLGCLVLGTSLLPAAEETPSFERQRDIIYGRKHGMALTLDVFQPRENANGIGLIWVVSGGWFSSQEAIGPTLVQPLLERGYTVFAVVHGSQPKFTIPEILEDMHRAVRFIRHHADRYGVDRERLGIYGGSAGGHLSLMQGVGGTDGNADDNDPVQRESSRVQAVACFFPPTDFLNYGKPGENALGRGILANFRAPFDFHEHDGNQNVYILITDESRVLEIGKQISPFYHVTPDTAPSLIIHGDADKLVPIQQAELMIAKLEEAGVPGKLIVKPEAEHGWPNLSDDLTQFADWFDQHLLGHDSPESPDR